jgi:DNA polymerase-3 subunit delta'
MSSSTLTFADVVGHDREIALLRRTLRSGRVAAAYLFAGPEHVGKTTVARAFAAALNCSRADDTACGDCVSCRKVARDNHPDVRFVHPDGATFRVHQVRDVRRQISRRPVEGRYKVYVLVDVDRMRPEAANALLKTLEEPPGPGVLVLLTTKASALLPTVRSRCVTLKFLPVPTPTLVQALLARGASQALAQQLALLTDGRVGSALAQLAADGAPLDEAIPDILRAPSLLGAFRMAQTWQEQPESLDVLLTWYRDLLLARIGAEPQLLTHQRHYATLRLLARQEGTPSLRNKIRSVMETRYLLQRNVNTALALEALAFRLMERPLLHGAMVEGFVA